MKRYGILLLLAVAGILSLTACGASPERADGIDWSRGILDELSGEFLHPRMTLEEIEAVLGEGEMFTACDWRNSIHFRDRNLRILHESGEREQIDGEWEVISIAPRVVNIDIAGEGFSFLGLTYGASLREMLDVMVEPEEEKLDLEAFGRDVYLYVYRWGDLIVLFEICQREERVLVIGVSYSLGS